MALTFFQASLLLLSSFPISEAKSHHHVLKHQRHHLHHKRAAVVVSNNLPTPWTSSGCYTDNVNGVRTLSGGGYDDGQGMTEESCISYCGKNNFIYAGTEYTGECYCGNNIGAGTGPTDLGDCSMPCAGNATEACGGPNLMNLFWSHGTPPPAPVTNPGPNGWKSLGCYSEGTNGRALANGEPAPNGASSMTVAICCGVCKSLGYTLAGVEYADECYCDNMFENGGAPATSGCNMVCAGNSSEYCGGSGHLNAYSLGTVSSSSSSSTPASSSGSSSTSTSSSSAASASSVNGWKALGCYVDGNPRTLQNGENVPGGSANMTNENCQAACKAAGYTIAGTEYSGECWCDNSFHNGGGPAPDGNAKCNMACNGNPQETCGGSSRLTVFSYGGGDPTSSSSSASASASTTAAPVDGFSYVGCYTEATNARALSAKVVNEPDMDIEYCAGNCTAFQLFGVEYGTECYCGNSLAAGSVPAPQTDCSFQCPGNQNEKCGAGNRLSLYQKGNGTLNGTVTSSATSSSASSTSTGSANSLPPGWKYAGCYSEGMNGRALVGNQFADNQQLTIETCVNECVGLGYSVAGMEYSVQCFCGNEIRNGGAKSPDTDCNMPCGGNSSETCGAGGYLSVYSNTTVNAYNVSAAQTSDLPGGWSYVGCLEDNVDGARDFQWEIINTNNNDADTCLTQCAEYGYMAAGMEYGEQCFCGDAVDVTNANATLRPESECNDPCTGNFTTICGGGNRLSYYLYNKTAPLYTWNYPTGPAAGAYEFLVGGVCIPLMTSPLRNGKVTFVEKFGTGEPNSTGAYELDLSDLSWRTMHVKTDVFCSASVVLPDKAGRQINIGGWSGDSTFGIRLYWPDGSPGVPGTNDWQENVEELTLQKGRWYPSAMVMTNGSILVIGGESGSNGPPVPSLELLPTVGPVVDLPWLAATDPLNLYPFISVLPSGGILVIYYNQAQIMDPVTFATRTQLPQLPGSVNNPGAGRTYPLEGTTMLMPQVAPYTDPLTVLVCGGSSTGASQVIDNCVSSQPEGNTTWVIERMPSQRVISCMTALPDGTYMILNGAHEGVAGFGLAASPNLNAVLYDPSKPVNKRMSIMANTTVARLYHSEAVLILDGRILVSGSDPQDGVNPEEYRVEVFVPPYLLSGAPRPSFTITNTDWTYGQTITISVTIPGAGPVKVSLIGAESSTHGNSMGQRTLFPAVSCAGGTCHITAPPNGNVCPPGWYKVFVLDGPTPSVGQFVRIGGDPGELGNWPDYPDFNVPGV